MPIMSYLAYPVEGRKAELLAALDAIGNCDVEPAENHNLLVIVTDTRGRKEEEQLQNCLKSIDSLALLALIAGYNDPEREPEGRPQ